MVAGDGIGPEVVAEGLKCLAAATEGTDIAFETTEFDLGAKRWHATGETLTDADLAAIRGHDVILLGAIGDPRVPSGVLERGRAACRCASRSTSTSTCVPRACTRARCRRCAT